MVDEIVQTKKDYSRYTLDINPAYFDVIKKGELKCYKFELPNPAVKGAVGDNDKSVASYLNGIHAGDSLVFRVDPQILAAMDKKRAPVYNGELERKVARVERVSERVYVHFA